MSAAPDQIPVAEQLLERTEDGPALVGSVCSSCGTHYFPTSVSCRNPACEDKQVEGALLGRTGTLYSWTVQGYQPPALFRMDDWEPYAIGLVEVPEGLRVLAMLTEREQLEIGMPLELVLEPLYVDEAGREVLTYKYAPQGPA